MICPKIDLEAVANDYFTTALRYANWKGRVKLENKDTTIGDTGIVGAVVLTATGNSLLVDRQGDLLAR